MRQVFWDSTYLLFNLIFKLINSRYNLFLTEDTLLTHSAYLHTSFSTQLVESNIYLKWKKKKQIKFYSSSTKNCILFLNKLVKSRWPVLCFPPFWRSQIPETKLRTIFFSSAKFLNAMKIYEIFKIHFLEVSNCELRHIYLFCVSIRFNKLLALVPFKCRPNKLTQNYLLQKKNNIF